MRQHTNWSQRRAWIVSLATALIAASTPSHALELVAQAQLSPPTVGCATAPDVAFWQGGFQVVYSSSSNLCSMVTSRVLASTQVIVPARVFSMAVGSAPAVTSMQQLRGAVASTDAPPQTLVFGAITREAGPTSRLHWATLSSSGDETGGSGSIPELSAELSSVAMDCLGPRCTLSSVENNAVGAFARRVTYNLVPPVRTLDTMPRMVSSAIRTNVIDRTMGAWELFSTGQPAIVAVNPIGTIVTGPLSVPSQGFVGTRVSVTGVRSFLSLTRSATSVIQVHDEPGTPSIDTINLSEPLELTDVDYFVADNARILTGFNAGVSTIRAVIYSESPRRALTTNAVAISASGGSIGSVRIAAGRGAQEGRALIVYETRMANTQSSVWAALVQCTVDGECEDGDPNNCDRCAADPAGARRCMHAAGACSSRDVVSADATADSGGDADSGADADSGGDAAADGEASANDDRAIDGDSSAALMDARPEDAASSEDARGVVLPRITGGACNCRAAAVTAGPMRGPRASAALLVSALFGARRRRRRP